MLIALTACADGAPVFDPLPADRVVTVGQTVVIPLRAADPEGGPVRFGGRGLPRGSTLENGEFRWSPLASDGEPEGRAFPVTFLAEDDTGARRAAPVVITVYSGHTRPTFTTPTAFVLDRRHTDTLRLPLAVRDDDSEGVTFEVIEAPEGAVLDEKDNKSAEIRWTPTPDQLARRRVFAFTINAWDERPTDATQQRITVVVVD